MWWLIACSDHLLVYEKPVTEYVYIEDTSEPEIEYVYIEDTAADPVWVDSFTQPNTTDGVDIVWVVDRSGSMNNNQSKLESPLDANVLVKRIG